MDLISPCPACEAPLVEGDYFCEQCGARIADDEAASSDRVECDLAEAGAVSDRGRVHRRNEDAFHLELPVSGRIAAVICDGISSSSAGDRAAQAAAASAGAVLARAASESATNAEAATLEAIQAAHEAVSQVAWTTRIDRAEPSCTLVCALCRDGEIAVGSVGDSRAYWVDTLGARQLTVDDSWAQEQVTQGLLSAEEALRDPRSHSITHWIGADAPDRLPRLIALQPDGPGRLVLCSDGLWNYVLEPAELGELIGALPAGASPAAIARALTDVALRRGGRDNITVIAIDIDPRGS
jgi:PPM family protein phosphatase